MHRILATVLLSASVALAVAADTASIAGKWKIHSNIQGYEGQLECSLTQDGVKVAGTCKSAEAPEKPIAMTGKFEDGGVTLQYKSEYNGEELTIVYTAKVESTDKFAGRVDVQPMGVDGEFTATAVK